MGVRSSEVATSNLAEVPLGISTTMLTEGKGAKDDEEEEEEGTALSGKSCHGLTSTTPTPPPPFPPSPPAPSAPLATAVTKTRDSAVPHSFT